MDQLFTGNLNELALNKIKQEKTKTIYYRIVKRNRSQPHNLFSNIQSPNFRKPQEKIAQLNQRSPNYKNIISPIQRGIHIENVHQNNNNQGNFISIKQENQSMKQIQNHYHKKFFRTVKTLVC
ncbi:unnamed protein product (macronuclear) [Paramecium tetraurelia]|uniref:Uncharacterized protein n=1 Tax=Paramecium tetraurelia TaxID=5888 RepID=A0DHU9_PARTE|nr:uncharacterized protein GSPATT00039491001 [Paramecium tetraurelia]CAK82616.1 unnamed protein product [Paramecium tetraurelia]|eukprot:XP_001450013.1 hypothetical protein (macronuclear) [Paramecium tetraurelia strain d4-2]